MPKFYQLLTSRKNQKTLVIILFVFILIVGIAIHTQLWSSDTKGQDIYYVWLEGKRILSGENPYARVLSGNMRENDKYATYFPLFYLLGSLTQWLGWRDYSEWINLWRHIFLAFNLGIAGLLFSTFYQYKLFIIALLASLFWLFNRWTLLITKIVHLEFMAIFFLVLSLILFSKNKDLSLVCFSISLAVKQIAIFLLPLYLIWIWQSAETEKAKKSLIALSVILSVPLITSLFFIAWNAEGFFKSILFSATRNPQGHFPVPSLDVLITPTVPNFVGIKAKLPMLFLMSLVYLGAFKNKLEKYTSSLLTIFIFIDFNSVIFYQYLCWVVPLIPLSICDFVQKDQKTLN